MGMLIDFYTGDAKRITDAWHRDDADALGAAPVVAAHADLSFHVWQDDLDELVRAACALTERPSLTFAECVLGEVSPDAESGIHELSDAFRDVFAAVGAERAGELFDRWMERLPSPPQAAARPRRAGLLRAARRRLETVLFGAIVLPIFAVSWLLSPELREARRRNRAKRADAVESAQVAPQPTLRDAVASLVETCRTAQQQDKPVLYAWSL